MVPVIAGKSLRAGTTLFLDMFSFVSILRIITIGTVGRLPRFSYILTITAILTTLGLAESRC